MCLKLLCCVSNHMYPCMQDQQTELVPCLYCFPNTLHGGLTMGHDWSWVVSEPTWRKTSRKLISSSEIESAGVNGLVGGDNPKCQCKRQSVPWSLCQSFPWSLCQSVPWSLCQSVPWSLCQSFPWSLCQPVPWSLYQSFPRSVRQSVSLWFLTV